MGGIVSFSDIAPILSETEPQSGGGHYFYQDTWALRRLAEFSPGEHHDFGSRLDGFAAQATAICAVIYYDIRPPKFVLPRFDFHRADLRALSLPNESLASVSCLHVAEHIGLGRYGDELDPEGTKKACRELERIISPNGQLLFSMPIGAERVEFNAQRIWHPLRPISQFGKLELQEFSVVSDDNVFLENARPEDFSTQKYACGLYRFRRR
jgi:SAM-dependent methyltransferase